MRPKLLTSQTTSAAALLIAAALALILLRSGSAYAHAGYESSTPADGEVLAESPPEVHVYTSQEMARSGGLPVLTVVNDAGDVLNDSTTLDDEDRTHVFAELPPELPDGRYTVIWHTISDEDGEEAQGAFHFYVGDGPSGTTPPAASETPAGSATPSPSPDDDGDDGGIPAWALVVGVLAGVVAGGGAGAVIGRRRA
jgi:methionine-rich copper-binding protein CopC